MTDSKILLAALDLAAGVYLEDALRARGQSRPDAVNQAMRRLHTAQRLSARIASGELLLFERATEPTDVGKP